MSNGAMKPAPAMEGKPAVDVQQPEIRFGSSSKRKALVLGAVIGVVVLLVVVGVSVGIFYLGMNAERDSAKEAWMKFKTPDDDMIIKQLLIVKATEVDIRRPGVIRKIIDYGQNRLVMQFDTSLHGDEEVYCYVYDFEPGTYSSVEVAEEFVTSGQDTHVVPSGDTIVYESTGVEVPAKYLSPTAREMCFGATILRVRKIDAQEDEGKKIQKRSCSESCVKICLWHACSKVCVTHCD